MAAIKLPKKRMRVTLDDAIFVTNDRVYVDLRTVHGDLLLAFDAECLSALIGEVANSIRANPLERKPRPKVVGGRAFG